MQMDKKVLFAEFPPVTTDQWEEVILKDLKGADYERKLIRKTLEGINIKPYYRSENLQGLNYITHTKPGDFPYLRGSKPHNQWLIRQDIIVEDFKAANKLALAAIERGAESISFIIKSLPAINANHMAELLNGFPFDKVEINFSAGKHTKNTIQLFSDFLKQKQIDTVGIEGSFSYDPLGCVTISGSFCDSGLDDKTVFNREFFQVCMKNLPEFDVITVHANHFKNAGASIVQELAFGLSMANEYLVSATAHGISIDDIAPRIRFNFGVGPEYFMEIAKLRAARYLWAKIVEVYKPCCPELAQMQVHSVTAEYNQTIYDPYVNMLRSTTEAMAAIIGGTGSLTVLPFNIQFDESNPFSERIARNQQIILKKESYLDKVADPSAGSYFIENLTASIIQNAWQLFTETEEKGGYLAAFKQGFVQQNISKTAEKRILNVASRQEILLGTNQYPNFHEKAKESLRVRGKKAGAAASCENMIAEPIKIFRAAEAFEELRLKTEESGKTPKVFLFTYGNLAMRKARATFSTNFFACAGFEIIDNNGFATVNEGIQAARDSKSAIVVICSSDEEYPVIAKEIVEGLKDKLIVIAGYPKDALEQLQSSGIKYFIHIKSNVLETLQQFQKELGI
jgi:methylmalonyl-CoA mutase